MVKSMKEKGFTLIEIMVAIAIIGILVAIAVPNFISYRDASYCTAAETDARSVASAIADYFATPTHTNMPNVSDLNIHSLSNGNTFLISSVNPDILIIVKIETPNRCPKDYQLAAKQPDAESNGWDGVGGYYLVIRNKK